MNKSTHLISIVFLSFMLIACNQHGTESATSHQQGLKLTSSVMTNGGDLPITYTCDGDSISPPLQWEGAPATTKEFVVIMHHNAPDNIHWYWLMYNIPANIHELANGQVVGQLGSNSVNGKNQYAPPCSKGPGIKKYTFTVYALSTELNLPTNATINRDTLLAAMANITLDSAELTVNYSRPFQRQHSNNQQRCTTIKNSIQDAGFSSQVAVSCDDIYAYIASSTYPKHDLMNGITGTNEQIPVPAEAYAAPIKLKPEPAKQLTTIDAALGVAVNGVPIYDYSSQGELDVSHYDKNHDTLALGQLDNCGGHAGRGDDYHYHVAPTCMIDAMKNAETNPIIGWAYDGYPIYADKNPDNSPIAAGDLDLCNGQADSKFGYRYHTSATPPYIIQCLVGKVDTAKLPRVAPLSGDNNAIRADLKPPAGGVENLQHSIDDNGTRTMSYRYQGEDYFVSYTPSKQPGKCYDFTQKTVSNGGKIEQGTFCREPQPNQPPPPVVHQPQAHHFRLDAWADNWFAAYLGEDLLVEDSVPITTERSFNAESVEFSADYPLHLNLIIKDFKQNNTGLEYIGARNQQMGDGGFIMQITDTMNNEVVAVTNQQWKCKVLHKAPLNKACEREANPVAGVPPCEFIALEAPSGWKSADFDDTKWANATVHDSAAVGPKDGYRHINWSKEAQFIWGADLETDNTLICRTTINQPKP
jgi:Raf kinase inhibitor-like YbhB/YbcL family protein